MKKISTLLFTLFVFSAHSQESELYKEVFENKNNFIYLDWIDENLKKNNHQYNVLDMNFPLHYKTFKFDHNVYYSEQLIDSLQQHTLDDYRSGTQIDYAKKSCKLFTIEEQDYLYSEALKSTITRVDIKSNKINMISEVANEQLYFRVSNIIYSKNHLKAYVKVEAYNNNHLIGHSFFIFELKQNHWKQVYQDESIIF